MQSNLAKYIQNEQPTGKTVLLVEDDAAIAELLIQIIVQETPFQVFAVPDGPQALDIVKNIRPNLLLLDYWLPTMHGIELYDRLCAMKELAQVPTIMLSVNPPLAEIKKRKIIYMKKPFDVDQLVQTIQTLISFS
jgi:DNA-binding response OmpR family regulator